MNEGHLLSLLVCLAVALISSILYMGVKEQQDINEFSRKCSSFGGSSLLTYEGKEKVLGCFTVKRVGN